MMEIRLAFPNEGCNYARIGGSQEIFGRSWQHSVAKNGYPDADTTIEDIISGQAYV